MRFRSEAPPILESERKQNVELRVVLLLRDVAIASYEFSLVVCLEFFHIFDARLPIGISH